jgi:hypothetical protein
MRMLLPTAIVLVTFVMQATAWQDRTSANEALFEAARAGDTAAITAALDRGADVNAKARYAMTSRR